MTNGNSFYQEIRLRRQFESLGNSLLQIRVLSGKRFGSCLDQSGLSRPQNAEMASAITTPGINGSAQGGKKLGNGLNLVENRHLAELVQLVCRIFRKPDPHQGRFDVLIVGGRKGNSRQGRLPDLAGPHHDHRRKLSRKLIQSLFRQAFFIISSISQPHGIWTIIRCVGRAGKDLSSKTSSVANVSPIPSPNSISGEPPPVRKPTSSWIGEPTASPSKLKRTAPPIPTTPKSSMGSSTTSEPVKDGSSVSAANQPCSAPASVRCRSISNPAGCHEKTITPGFRRG